MNVVFILPVTNGKPTGLMVGCNYDESFVGMLTIEVDGYINSTRKSEYIMDNGSCIVIVGSPIYFTPFDHDEKAIGIIHHINSLTGNIGQGNVGGRAINFVLQSTA